MIRSDETFRMEVLARAKHAQRERRSRQRVWALSLSGAACLGLILALALQIPPSPSPAQGPGAVSYTLGALFVSNASLGYIMVGLLAFILGICFTLLSVHLREKNRK